MQGLALVDDVGRRLRQRAFGWRVALAFGDPRVDPGVAPVENRATLVLSPLQMFGRAEDLVVRGIALDLVKLADHVEQFVGLGGRVA
ncbi:MAG: hypothetical protein V3V08_01740 [Nannocystaceae bacterium]